MATHNGAPTLPTVLEAYERLLPPIGHWELVVVDNASNDETASILKCFEEKLPLHAMFTPQRGKNIALNLGLEKAHGSLIVFTDDDAIPDRTWLRDMQVVASTQVDYDIFAGQIDPLWPPGTPDWIERLVPLGATYALTPPELKEGPIPAAQVWGPNMAIRRQVFDDGHRFDEAIGPQAGQYVMGSEVEFTCRMERRGHRAYFSPIPRVQHVIRPQQLDREWIIRRAYRLGRHMFQQDRPDIAPSTQRIYGAPRWRYRQLLEQRARAIWFGILGNFDAKFRADWEVSFLRGYIGEAKSSVDR